MRLAGRFVLVDQQPLSERCRLSGRAVSAPVKHGSSVRLFIPAGLLCGRLADDCINEIKNDDV